MRVDLGNQQWAEILDVGDVPRKVKFKVQEWALARYKADEEHYAIIGQVTRDMLTAYVITDWSFDEPIPKGEPEKLGDLRSSAYDKLMAATEEHYLDLDFIRNSAKYSGSKTTSEESSPKDTSPTAATSAL